jgi:hypothetical protein
MEASRSVESILAQTEALIAANQMQRAEDNLIELFENGSEDDLRRLKETIAIVVAMFLPRRRKRLNESLQHRLADPPTAVRQDAVDIAARVALERYVADLGRDLNELRDHHIFTWGTYYRDVMRGQITNTLNLLNETRNQADPYPRIKQLYKTHATEIFTKGYLHLRDNFNPTQESMVGKSLAGLSGFLAVATELYSDQATHLTTAQDCRVLRRITSAVIAGILLGYMGARLGASNTKSLLLMTVKSWAYVLPLMRSDDLQELASHLTIKDKYNVLGDGMSALVTAIDTASDQQNVDPVVLISAVPNLDDGAFDIALRPPADSLEIKPLEIAVLAGPANLISQQLVQRQKRGYLACITNAPSLNGVGDAAARLAISIANGPQESAKLLFERLRFRNYENTGSASLGAPLKTNIAERFPLEIPTSINFFRVTRPSIKALNMMLSTRTGILLWCSVRRSGKTMGVTELASASDQLIVVSQRCELSGSDEVSKLLFDRVRKHLQDRQPLPAGFLRATVNDAFPMTAGHSGRVVLMVDEYDRLFGALRAFGRDDDFIRQVIVQPLLDQMVAFATDNLVVLIGQHPGAHYIFMDQNQLSAYVQQQPYPLFAHDAEHRPSEFEALISKVFQKTLKFDREFLDAVYAETSGHPFLTVNLLRDLVDFLIKKKVFAGTLLTREHFDEYASSRLNIRSISGSTYFEYFRQAASEALSSDGRKSSPWVHGVYALLGALGARQDAHHLCPTEDALRFIDGILESSDLTTYSAESFLTSAAYSNFIRYDESGVSPRINILARIAAGAIRRANFRGVL